MRSIKYYIGLLALLVVFISCKENEATPVVSETEDSTSTDSTSTPKDSSDITDGDKNIDSLQVGSGEVNGYTLVWQDLFDGENLNKDNWNIEIDGNGGGNAELEYYREENVSIEKEPVSGQSCLALTAKKEVFGGQPATSGRITTQDKQFFKYGKIEASIKLPKTANGLWPAFWMMGNDISTVGWPACGETDIMEFGSATGIANGTQDRYFNGACHWGTAWNNKGDYAKNYTAPSSLQDTFHLFTLIWTENSMEMYLDLDKNPDAAPYYKINLDVPDDELAVSRYFRKPNFILFNLAVGGNFTGIHDINNVTALSSGEAKMYVNYVKVYQKK